MAEISTAAPLQPQQEVPLMVDNATYEIIEQSKQDTALTRLATYQSRAIDLSYAFEGTGATVEVDDEAVHKAYIGAEMAGLLARERAKQDRQLLRNEAGRSILVPLMKSSELRGSLALSTRAHLARLALSA